MQRTFRVLRLLRNSVHNEALDLMRDDRAYLVTMPTSAQEKLRAFLREDHPGWTVDTLGVRVQPPAGATAAKWLRGTGRPSVPIRPAAGPTPPAPSARHAVLAAPPSSTKPFPAALHAIPTSRQ